MASSIRILIAEDESIVALDLARRVELMGYSVVGVEASGEAVINLADQQRPDLVLMDIRLQGNDGIYAASKIRQRFDIPVVFVTAHSDQATLSAAKSASPFGYIIKPFEDRDLRTSIEIAVYRHQTEREMAHRERLLAATFRAVTDAIIAVDKGCLVTMMNPAAEELVRQPLASVISKSLSEVAAITVLGIGNSPVAIQDGAPTSQPVPMRLMHKDGTTVDLQGVIVNLVDTGARQEGKIFIFRPVVTERP
jgi:CheY-like chemotaxis protein